ncbi:MAG TPA: transposase [Victivallales bacterium]|nr:transposase [Victivallales bacterium]
MDNKLPVRKNLHHRIPDWVSLTSIYFITICTYPKGINQLCKKEVYIKIKDSAMYYQSSKKWWIHYFLLMPDHIHGLVSFTYSPDMHHTIKNWKRYIAKRCTIKWQRNFFDHRLRTDESYSKKEHYISMNPVRAGLADEYENWPYCWQGRDGYP